MQSATRVNLAETAVESIRAEIIAKRWAVGERLPNESMLAEMLSVSRGTIREAVRVLVAQGFLETRQGSGTYVCSTVDPVSSLSRIRQASLRDQFEARCALEAGAARLAALRHTPAMIAGLRSLLAQRGNRRSDNPDRYIGLDLAFHKAVISASGNHAMVEIYEFFSASIQETIEATLTDELPEPDLQAHIAIIDAIETRDPDKAASTVRNFMAPVLNALDRLLLS
ncbi:MAG: FadR/GntR family transcriptional regulator [Phyllobacterium sp.]